MSATLNIASCRKKFDFHDLACWKYEKLDLFKTVRYKLFLHGIDGNYLTFSIRITDEIQNPKLQIIIMALHLLRPSVHHFHCPFLLISALVLKVKRLKNPQRFLVVFSPRLSDEKLKEKKTLRNFSSKQNLPWTGVIVILKSHLNFDALPCVIN